MKPAFPPLFRRAIYILLWGVLGVSALYAWVAFSIAVVMELGNALPGAKLYDDAYMFLRYAKLWLAGYGESWNPGEGPVYGNTSQLHFLVVLLLRSLTPVMDRLVLVLSSALPALIFVFYLPAVCARHSTLFAESAGWKRYLFWCATTSAAFIYFSSVSMHFKTGMDACLSLLLHLVLVDAVLTWLRTPGSHRLPWLVLVTYLAFLTRPDNLLSCVVFVVGSLWWLGQDRRSAAIYTAAMAAVLVIDAAAKWQYFGDILPLSFYAKQKGFYEGFQDALINSPWFSFAHFLYGIWPFLLVLALWGAKEKWRLALLLLVPALLTMAYYFTLQTIMNLEARYFFPFTVQFIMAAVLCTEWNPRRLVSWRGLAILLLFGALYAGIGWMHDNRWKVAATFTQQPAPCDDRVLNGDPLLPELPKVPVREAYHAISNMMHQMPAGATIAMTEHGYVGAFNIHVNILDVMGLHNREVAHHGFSADWFYQQRPDAIWVPHWAYTCINARIFSDPRFSEQYEFYPRLFYTGYALHRASPHYDTLKQALQQEWQRLYPGLELKAYRQF